MLFGRLTDITGSNKVVVKDVSSTDELVQAINVLHPALCGIKYIIAVDKKTVQTNTALDERSCVALLPPFSGG